MEELVRWQTGVECEQTLADFSTAPLLAWTSLRRTCPRTTHSNDHAPRFFDLSERRIQLLGKLQRFRDQGVEMCGLSDFLASLHMNRESAT